MNHPDLIFPKDFSNRPQVCGYSTGSWTKEEHQVTDDKMQRLVNALNELSNAADAVGMWVDGRLFSVTLHSILGSIQRNQPDAFVPKPGKIYGVKIDADHWFSIVPMHFEDAWKMATDLKIVAPDLKAVAAELDEEQLALAAETVIRVPTSPEVDPKERLLPGTERVPSLAERVLKGERS